jgi:hypothetical protein
MRALSWAILAPNSHNLQPWKVDLSVPGQAVLYPDLDRLLPETDPFNRQITVSLGCFLELLRMAALQDGLAVEVDLFPDGEDPAGLDERPAAICRFGPATDAPDPLFADAAVAAQQQGALRHVPPGPGRRAGPHRVGRAVITEVGV